MSEITSSVVDLELISQEQPQHGMVRACGVVDEVIDEMADSDPIYLDPTSKRQALLALSTLIDRLEGIRLGVLATALTR